jgi:hypothetical protein
MLLKSDQGGNIFNIACQWDANVYGTARMREVAVYKRRRATMDWMSRPFYMQNRLCGWMAATL